MGLLIQILLSQPFGQDLFSVGGWVFGGSGPPPPLISEAPTGVCGCH